MWWKQGLWYSKGKDGCSASSAQLSLLKVQNWKNWDFCCANHLIRFTQMYLYLQQTLFLVFFSYPFFVKLLHKLWLGDFCFQKSEWVDCCIHQGLMFYLAVYSRACLLKTNLRPRGVQIGNLLWFIHSVYFLFCRTDKELDGQSGRERHRERERHTNTIKSVWLPNNTRSHHNYLATTNSCLRVNDVGKSREDRNQFLIIMKGRRRWAGRMEEAEMEGWRKTLLSDTVVVSKGRCPGATAAPLLRDGADWRLSCPTWANKYTQETAEKKTEE